MLKRSVWSAAPPLIEILFRKMMLPNVKSFLEKAILSRMNRLVSVLARSSSGVSVFFLSQQQSKLNWLNMLVS